MAELISSFKFLTSGSIIRDGEHLNSFTFCVADSKFYDKIPRDDSEFGGIVEQIFMINREGFIIREVKQQCASEYKDKCVRGESVLECTARIRTDDEDNEERYIVLKTENEYRHIDICVYFVEDSTDLFGEPDND
jgi:hypothetical protein